MWGVFTPLTAEPCVPTMRGMDAPQTPPRVKIARALARVPCPQCGYMALRYTTMRMVLHMAGGGARACSWPALEWARMQTHEGRAALGATHPAHTAAYLAMGRRLASTPPTRSPGHPIRHQDPLAGPDGRVRLHVGRDADRRPKGK